MPRTVLLPTSIALTPLARDGVRFVAYDPHEPVPDEETDAEVLVVWGNTISQLANCARRMPRLRLVQALAAGPDFFARVDFGPDVALASGVGLHDIFVAEHALALSLAAARALPRLLRAQIGRRWATELGWAADAAAPDADTHLGLHGRHVAIWGFGHIGQHLAPLLAALGARVTGVARSAGERAGFPVVTREGLDELAPSVDQLIMILPNSPDTVHALDASLLARLPDHAWVINVGRGSTIDTPALVAALHQERLGGAALDVFEREPLPVASPLWAMENVIVTPHAAGGHPLGVEQLLDSQLAALASGAALRNLISPTP